MFDNFMFREMHIGRLRCRRVDAIFVACLFLLAFGLRWRLLPIQSADYYGFLKPWMDSIRAGGGWRSLGVEISNYSPMYMYIMTALSYLGDHDLYALKLVSVLFDYAAAVAVFLIVYQMTGSGKRSVFGMVFTLFLPAVVLDGAYWCQCDILYTTFLLFAFYFFLRDNGRLCMILVGVAFAFKLQALFLLPFLILMWAKKKTIRTRHFLWVPAVYLLSVFPAWVVGRDLGDLLTIYFRQSGAYPWGTLEYPNLYALLGEAMPDLRHAAEVSGAGLFLCVAVLGCVAYLFYTRRVPLEPDLLLLLALFTVAAAVYTLPHMHDRYGFLVDLLALIYGVVHWKRLPVSVGFSLVSIVTYMPYLIADHILPIEVTAIALLGLLVWLGMDLVRRIQASPEVETIVPTPITPMIEETPPAGADAETPAEEPASSAEAPASPAEPPAPTEPPSPPPAQDPPPPKAAPADKTPPTKPASFLAAPLFRHPLFQKLTPLRRRAGKSDLTRLDLYTMGVLTALCAVLVFFQIGHTYAPQTSYALENPEIILDFGEYVDVSSLSLYLNSQSDRVFALSAFNEVTQDWELFNGEAAVGSVFTWNKIEINYRLRYLGIVSTVEGTVLNELVAVAPDGAVLTPVNAGAYPALFDEQWMFPGTKTYQDGTMFDEVYHGRTAYEFLHGLPTYETTHPHLGKILIAAGVAVFGMTPFGMRFMGALFGILMIPLLYLFAKRLFNSTFVAAFTTCLLLFDCMHFTLSRIATIDVFAAFFILLMYYFMYWYLQADTEYRRGGAALRDALPPKHVLLPLALCGVSMGLGIATKWTGVYAGAGLALVFLLHTVRYFPKKQLARLFAFCCVFFIAVPLAIYTLSFFPVVSGYHGLLDKAFRGTVNMFNYHSGLVAEHYYSSPYYQWPVIWKPLLMAWDLLSPTEASAVNCMGNPVIWWVGIPCLLYVTYRCIVKKDRMAGFLILAYLAQYVPWMLVPRLTFIYHYFPSAIIMILCMGYVAREVAARFASGKKAVCFYLIAAIGCFFLFYPVISGIPCSRAFGMSLKWLRSWAIML